MEPIKNGIVTFPYGAQYRNGQTHKGVDYRANKTPVQACVSGVVVHSGRHVFRKGWGIAFGIHVIVMNDRFPDGSPGLWAGYCHLSKTMVTKGQRIQMGQIIGISGNTGNSVAPHLHLQILASRTWNPLKHVNPRKWVKA
jgi:murein DD-endopeptidase MepM/ murein hydrolase activator NlpD